MMMAARCERSPVSLKMFMSAGVPVGAAEERARPADPTTRSFNSQAG